jgi:hypothetical protein
MSVNRAGESEHQTSELVLRRTDERVDLLPAVSISQRVRVARVLGPQLIDELPASPRVGLVPDGDLPLSYVLHWIPFLLGCGCLSARYFAVPGIRCRLRLR